MVVSWGRERGSQLSTGKMVEASALSVQGAGSANSATELGSTCFSS